MRRSNSRSKIAIGGREGTDSSSRPDQSATTSERIARVGDLEIAYETFGDRADPAMLLVMGLGMQMIAWPEGFCEALSARGYHVIRFDNRDSGHSTWFDHKRAPSLWQWIRRDHGALAYTLSDLAADAVGLLDALGIERAHVVGASMGGMIAQLIAIEYPERVATLASIMSNTGLREGGRPAPRAIRILLRRSSGQDEAAIESAAAIFRIIGSPGFADADDDLRAVIARSYARGYNPAGTARQLHAILLARGRTNRLRSVTVPTVVIHGLSDILVRPSGGRATAAAIPGAELIEIEGMGHDLPPQLWGQIIDAISANTARGRWC